MLGGHVAVVVVFGVAEDVVCTVVVGVLEHEMLDLVIPVCIRFFIIDDEYEFLAYHGIAGFGGTELSAAFVHLDEVIKVDLFHVVGALIIVILRGARVSQIDHG